MKVIEDIEVYHAGSAVSHSKLRTFHNIGPYGYHARHIRGEHKFKRTPAMVLGCAFEDWLMVALDMMTHEEFDAAYAVKPEGFDGRTKNGRTWLANMKAADQMVIATEDKNMFESMLASIDAMDGMMETLRQAEPQCSYRIEFPGLPGIQSRPDFSLPENGFMGRAHIDLKTIDSLNGIENSIINYGYHTQAAMVANTTTVDEYHLLVVEKAFPYRAQLIRISAGYIDLGTRWCMRKLGELRGCFETDTWPRVLETHRTVEPPAWLIAREAS